MDGQLNNPKILFERIAKSDEKAFRILYEAYWGRIYAIVIHYFHSHLLAQDMVQEVFLKIWVKRTDLLNVDFPDAYINRITRNMVIDQMRKKMIEISVSEINTLAADVPCLQEQNMESKEIGYQIRLAIATLSPQQRQVYELSKEQGLKLKEVAEIMSISYNTAREYMSLALKGIRKYLQEHLGNMYILALIFILS